MKTFDDIIAEHPFFRGLEPAFCRLIAGCGRNVVFNADDYLFREGEPADQFYLIRHGKVAFEVNVPGRGAIRFLTLQEGEIAGISWLVSPYRWTYTAKAVELTRAVALDAVCLRGKCEADHHLGYELFKRFVPELARRLQATRLQMFDVYGPAA